MYLDTSLLRGMYVDTTLKINSIHQPRSSLLDFKSLPMLLERKPNEEVFMLNTGLCITMKLNHVIINCMYLSRNLENFKNCVQINNFFFKAS